MKRTDWLIAGILALIFLFIVGGIMIYWLQTNAYANLPTEKPGDTFEGVAVEDGITAKNAFEATADIAKQWQADALAVSASATIARFDSQDDLYGGRTNWTIVYYSPIASAVGTYTVTGNRVNFLNAKKVDFVPQLLDVANLQLDSGQAMTVAVQSGGLNLLSTDGQRIAHLSLNQQPETGRAEWQILLQNQTSGAARSFLIDATTGEILE